MKIADYLSLLDDAERRMADAFTLLATRHSTDGEIRDTANRLATWSVEKRASLGYSLETYGRGKATETERLFDCLFAPHPGGFGVLRDVHDASVLLHHAQLCWTGVEQAAKALFDSQLVELCKREQTRTERQARWLRTMFKVNAPQALTVAPEPTSMLRATLQSMKPRFVVASAAFLAIGVAAAVARRAMQPRT